MRILTCLAVLCATAACAQAPTSVQAYGPELTGNAYGTQDGQAVFLKPKGGGFGVVVRF